MSIPARVVAPTRVKAGQVQAHGFCGGAFADDDVQPEVLQGGIHGFLNGGVQSVNFVYEEDVAGLKRGQQRGDVSGALQGGAGGGVEPSAHFAGDDDGQSGFSESGRPEEQGVIQGFAAFFCGGDEHRELPPHFGLADIFVQGGGTQAAFQPGFGVVCGGGGSGGGFGREHGGILAYLPDRL